jgi:chromate reductase
MKLDTKIDKYKLHNIFINNSLSVPSLERRLNLNCSISKMENEHSVKEFQNQIKIADGLIISSPEYAHGVPGTLKNALDWLVGSSEMVDKPVALLSASTRSQIAQESLVKILKTMSAHVVLEASVGFDLLGQNKTETDIAQDPVLSEQLKKALGLV